MYWLRPEAQGHRCSTRGAAVSDVVVILNM